MKTNKLVVLTFDDAVSNHATLAGPLLKEYGFGATFFVCEFPPDFTTNKQQYMTWEQMRGLSDDGFEIANHTLTHPGASAVTPQQWADEIDALDARCVEHGIPTPTTFAYPGCDITDDAVEVLRKRGCQYARIGGARAYAPQSDDPLLVPSFPVHGEDPQVYYDALATGKDGKIPVLMFHGLPEYTHPWVNTPAELFQQYMKHLANENYTVIALRDLPKYLD